MCFLYCSSFTWYVQKFSYFCKNNYPIVYNLNNVSKYQMISFWWNQSIYNCSFINLYWGYQSILYHITYFKFFTYRRLRLSASTVSSWDHKLTYNSRITFCAKFYFKISCGLMTISLSLIILCPSRAVLDFSMIKWIKITQLITPEVKCKPLLLKTSCKSNKAKRPMSWNRPEDCLRISFYGSRGLCASFKRRKRSDNLTKL